MKPGSTVAPRRSITLVRGPTSAATSATAPTCAILLSRRATARASRRRSGV
jgi:hypothetical protein